MLKVIPIVYKLIWIAADTWKLKFHLIANTLIGVAIGLIMFFTPLSLSELIGAISLSNKDAILMWFYVLAGLSLGLVVVKFLMRYYTEYISAVLPIKLKEKYYEKIFRKSYDWHVHNSVGYFLSALNKVCNVMHNWLWKMCYDYISNLVMAIAFGIYTYMKSPILFAYFFVGMFVFGIVARLFYGRRMQYIDIVSKLENKFDKTYTDFVYNIRGVKKMNLLNFVNMRLNKRSASAFVQNGRMMRYNAVQWGFTELYLAGLFLVPTAWFIYQYIANGTGLDIVVMIIAIQGNISNMGREFMHLMHELARNKVQTDLLAKHLNDLNAKEANAGKRNIRNWHKITFENTYFEFEKDGTQFRHSVPSFEINRGDHIAVVGKSGEGKSTFLNLLTRQFYVKRGQIAIDGIDYTNVNEDFFNTKMTYISQDVELFDMSFYDNIVLGKQISRKKLDALLKGCCLDDLVARMGGDLNHSIGEKGIKVSGGERQRINLARGLLLGRDILVLDEITANLDPVTTQKIWNYIFSEYGDKTIIAISHETGLLNHVNKIIRFKKGVGSLEKN